VDAAAAAGRGGFGGGGVDRACVVTLTVGDKKMTTSVTVLQDLWVKVR
jgi:hypothetical protein